jgi:GxxExxY protein
MSDDVLGVGDDRQTFEIIGAALEVHKALGCGFLERVYRDPFAIELSSRGIPFERERTFRVRYKGRVMPTSYVIDFLCYGEVVVELKALAALGPIDHAQVINYLRVCDLRRALLLNFGTRSLQFKRIVWDDPETRTHRERRLVP